VNIATPTSGANVVKVLALILALDIPHHIQVVGSTKNDEWFHDINPLKMVPALEATDTQDGKRLNIWESSACLDYVARTYDTKGEYGGRNTWEEIQIRNWLTMHTSGLG
jgi:gliotoxin/aspirochlorine biosynthesis glutathione S-transferase